MSVARTALGRTRRNHEFALGFHALVVIAVGYVLLAFSKDANLPPDLAVILGSMFGLYIGAHIALRKLAPNADGTLLPIVAMLNGIGFVTISRLDNAIARNQAVWSAVGVGLFILTLIVVHDIRVLERNRYTCAFVGVGLLLLPLIPSPVGVTLNGARIWARIGPISFQPGEIAKILLVVFFAGYLVDTRELLSRSSRRVGRLRIPDPRHIAPLIAIWALSMLVLVFEQDLGSSLLQFCVFASMLYIATGRSRYVWGGLTIFSLSAFAAYKWFDHVQVRVTTWINPWPTSRTGGYQIIQSWYAFANGGVSGRGIGLGSPDRIPVAVSDFILAAIGEELGLFGSVAIVLMVLLLVGSGLRIAIDQHEPFTKLLVSGLTIILGVQTFVIVGGVTRLIPLTGVTLPFVSYGGSSLIGNFIVVALLARASDSTTGRRQRVQVP